MTQAEKNKAFYLTYLKALSGKAKTKQLISRYVEDEKLINHSLFFEQLFPEYELIIDELIAEGNRVFVRSHFVGTHRGGTDAIPATQQKVKTPFAVGYEIKNEKIVDFWAIANEMELFEQLGLAREQVDVL